MVTNFVTTSLFMSLVSVCFSALVVSPLIDVVGHRALTMAGTILSTAGLLTAAYAPTIGWLYVGFGVLTGRATIRTHYTWCHTAPATKRNHADSKINSVLLGESTCKVWP